MKCKKYRQIPFEQLKNISQKIYQMKLPIYSVRIEFLYQIKQIKRDMYIDIYYKNVWNVWKRLTNLNLVSGGRFMHPLYYS